MGWMKRFDQRPEYVKAGCTWWEWHIEPMTDVLVLALQGRQICCEAKKPAHKMDCSRR